jgi:hypothetical protein
MNMLNQIHQALPRSIQQRVSPQMLGVFLGAAALLVVAVAFSSGGGQSTGDDYYWGGGMQRTYFGDTGGGNYFDARTGCSYMPGGGVSC